MSYDPNGLSSVEYEHIADRQALAALKKIPAFDKIFAAYLDFYFKATEEINKKGACYRVTAKTYPRLYNIYQTALERLNMNIEPDLYIDMSYDYNACIYGTKESFITVNSSVVQNFSDSDLLFLLGHELGHVKSEHLLYHNLTQVLFGMPKMLGNLIGNLVSSGLEFALMDWRRKAEYTADRAGLIAAADYDSVKNCIPKVSGSESLPDGGVFSVDELMEQCCNFEEIQDDVIGKIIYVTQTASRTHPWMITRIQQLKQWYESGEFDALMDRHGIK